MFFDNDDAIIDKSFSQIIETIKNQDKEALKKMFSEQSLNEAKDFGADIDHLFDFVQGTVESWERTGGPGVSEGRNDDGSGRVWKEIRATYDIKTTERKYHVSIQEVTKHSKNPNLVGISSFCIISSEDWNEEYNYWGCFGLPESFETLGIVIEKKTDHAY